MNQLKIFKNDLFEVGAKVESDTVLFDVEQVAKCLGVSRDMNGKEYVRWERVNSYLPKSCPEVGKGDFIPEPLVYKLAFKANNEVAEQFQDWLAIEVIPSIRKNGIYKLPSDPVELALQTSLNNYQEIKGIKEDVDLLKDSMRIDGRQEYALKEQGKAKVLQELGGYGSLAYEKLSRKVFAKLWGDFKRHFILPRSMDLPRARFHDGVKFIEMWRPDTSLAIDIEAANKQAQFKLVE
ncbi:MAG: ORF6C domain-containing protein [Lysinibacillus sp.]